MNTVHVRAWERALAMLGGVAALAQHLEQPVWRVELWSRGSVSTPSGVFLKLVDLLLERELSQMREETGRIHVEREFGSSSETPK